MTNQEPALSEPASAQQADCLHSNFSAAEPVKGQTVPTADVGEHRHSHWKGYAG